MARRKGQGDFFALMENEEYVWAMRSSALEEKVEEDEEISESNYRLTGEISSADRKSINEEKLHVNKMALLASFVPDEIILNLNCYDTQTFDACILSGDVSGFTDLCEAYNKIGSGGPTRLTDMLNNFIGAMVQEIMSHGGDVIKFSGDAFLALWKCKRYTMRDYIQEVINCALIIQKNHNNYITDVGVTLRVKLAISSGTIYFSAIGDSNLSHYIEVGQPILDTKAILDICVAGDIIISDKSFAFVDASAYLTEVVFSGKYIRIFGVGTSWRQVDTMLTRSKSITSRRRTNLSEEGDSEESSESKESVKTSRSSEFALRPLVIEAANNVSYSYDNLKKFVIPPVMWRVELNEPLEYLTELRQVTVIMINIVPHKTSFHSLIALVKTLYSIITTHVQKYSGCADKVSCFDKDLMCVIIFGLRGFKQELECKNALLCARMLYNDMYVLTKIKSVSIGVSTGKTYCGVFGHTLRREYTVIGLTVNKAARLMVAYPDRVSCCNETFINCKMGEWFFERQEYVYLKGIKHPGPIYEFRYFEREGHKVMKPQEYPILGRDEEMTLFSSLLIEFIKFCKKDEPGGQCIKMMVIEGESKSGKTRLVEEFMYLLPHEISIRIIAPDRDTEDPYNIFKHLFYPAIGIDFDSSHFMRGEKIKSFIGNFADLETLCFLNQVFDVKYPVSKEYTQSKLERRTAVRGKIITYLAGVVFRDPVVIIIDKTTRMLPESWGLFNYLLDIRNIFIIAIIRSTSMTKFQECPWLLSSQKVHYLKLKKIEKLYYAALACQMIEVEAIPPDLENAIQSRSNGNPGWIKNLLICLQQDDAIRIKPMSHEEIYKNGLVAPPLYMMRRLTKPQLEIWKRIMEEKSKHKVHNSSDPWYKYVDSCREIFIETQIKAKIKEMFNDKKEVRACILEPTFEVFANHFEQSQEIVIIRTFDSLLFTEQFVAKCGSVLGWQFPRKMLEYVSGTSLTKREKAKAIQTLFEKRIFACSRGDFTEAGDYVIIRLRDKMNCDEQPVECNCYGLMISESCIDLPKYASCGYLHFTSNNFLKATYNLLTETQKVEFHQKAGRYLEKNTRKCRACGNGLIDETAGKLEKYTKTTRKGKKKYYSLGSYDDDHMSRASENESIAGSHSVIFSDAASMSHSMDSSSHYDISVMNLKRGRQKNGHSLTRTFSLFDFSNCECNLILNFMHGELTRHFRSAGQHDKMLKAIFLYAKSCMTLENITEALITLKKGEEHLKTRKRDPNEPQWKMQLLEAKLLTLKGEALARSNQIDDAKKCLLNAMDKYGSPFPKSDIGRYIKSRTLKLKQKIALYLRSPNANKQMKPYEAVYFNDVAICLHTLSKVFLEKKLHSQLELSAIWALHCALKADYEFKIICRCFKQMIYAAEKNSDISHCVALEIYALRYCNRKISTIQSDDIRCVADLYNMIRRQRVIRSEIENSNFIGYISLRLAISVNHMRLVIKVLTSLNYNLLLKNHIQEACSLLSEMDYYSCETDCATHESGRILFHISALRFHMETGYTFTPYQTSELHHYGEDLSLAAVKNSTETNHFVCLLWLWNCRNQKWEYASKWKTTMRNYVESMLSDDEHLFHQDLFILEGYLLNLVQSINSQSISSYTDIEDIVQQLFKKLSKHAKYSKLILPRLKHFQAYYELIKGNEEKAFKLLEDAVVQAFKQENALEAIHIEHSKEAWNNRLTPKVMDQWITHSHNDNLIDYHLVDMSEVDAMTYTLPKPLYD